MNYVTAGPVPSILATLYLLATILICILFGRALLSLLRAELENLSGPEKTLFSAAAGFGFLAVSLLILGIFALVRREIALAVLFLFAVTGVCAGKCSKQANASYVPIGLRGKYGPIEKILWIWVTAVLVLSWLQALAPPIGSDELSYHLYHPKIFIEQHKIFFIPLTRESLWPYLTEMLFMLGLLMQGTLLAKLYHWMFYALTAAAVYSFAGRFYGKKEALWALVFFLLCPAAFAQSGYAYVDLSLAFFTFLIFYGWALRSDLKESDAGLLSGFAAGGAMATKYLGLSSALIGTFFWFAGSKRRLKNAALYLTAAAVICGAWYLRSWFLSGNPVYPFFPHIFGSGLDFDISEGAGFSKSLPDFLKFGWDIVMFPQKFGGEIIGAQYLMFLPFLVFSFKNSKPVSKAMALFTLIYTFFLFKQSQYARFYISVIPFLSVGCAVSVSEIFKRSGRALKSAAIVALAGLMCVHAGIYLRRVKSVWPVVSGRQSAADYLSEKERSYKGFLYIRDHAKAGDRVLNAGDIRHFYSEHPGTVMDTLFLRNDLKAKGTTIRTFLEEKKFDYIWLQDDSEISRYLSENKYEPVYVYDFKEGPKTWHFTIYRSPWTV